MRTRVEKCPGGLAVVVPEPLAAEAGLRDGAPAELELAGGRLVVRPSGPVTLADLLAGVTPENLHEEWVDGPPTGTELL
jgi:antitoxin MazE